MVVWADDIGVGVRPARRRPDDPRRPRRRPELQRLGGRDALIIGRGKTYFFDDAPAQSWQPASVALHEVTHTLGAVQNGAPHSSKAGHCTDEWDIMCYADGSPTNPIDGSALTLPVRRQPGGRGLRLRRRRLLQRQPDARLVARGALERRLQSVPVRGRLVLRDAAEADGHAAAGERVARPLRAGEHRRELCRRRRRAGADRRLGRPRRVQRERVRRRPRADRGVGSPRPAAGPRVRHRQRREPRRDEGARQCREPSACRGDHRAARRHRRRRGGADRA